MFRPSIRLLSIFCLITLDILLVINIISNHTSRKTSRATENVSKINQIAMIQGKKVAKISIVSPTPTITPAPSITPTPLPSPVPTKTVTEPSITPTSAPQSVTQMILEQVNDFRVSNGLPAVQTDGYTCALATTRAQEISNGFSHDGFNNRVSSHTLPYPSYHYVNENIAMNSDPAQVVPMWIASPGHNENMKRDTTYVCIGKYGEYYAYEGWKP